MNQAPKERPRNEAATRFRGTVMIALASRLSVMERFPPSLSSTRLRASLEVLNP